MARFRADFPDRPAFREWVLAATDGEIRERIGRVADEWRLETGGSGPAP